MKTFTISITYYQKVVIAIFNYFKCGLKIHINIKQRLRSETTFHKVMQSKNVNLLNHPTVSRVALF